MQRSRPGLTVEHVIMHQRHHVDTVVSCDISRALLSAYCFDQLLMPDAEVTMCSGFLGSARLRDSEILYFVGAWVLKVSQ